MTSSAPFRIEGRPATLVFVHVPKCAGTTFRHALRQWFGAGLLIFDSHDEQALSAQVRDRDPPVSAIAGHFTFGVQRAVPGPHVLVSLVRDPVDRLVSFYRHVRDAADHPLHGAASTTLDRFYDFTRSDPRGRRQTEAIQCYFLSGTRTFEEARAVIGAHYAVVAPIEAYATFVERCALILDRPAVETAPRNISPPDPELDDAKAALASRIRHDHVEDVRLYDYVKARFAGLLAEASPVRRQA